MLGIELAWGYKDGSAQSMPPKRPWSWIFKLENCRGFLVVFFFFSIGPVGVLIFAYFQKATGCVELFD